ncbi:MAG: twin-arginine translocation pathway signal, partial [Methylocystis sp.]
RILRGIDPKVAATMTGLSQGSYLVANCCFDGQAAASTYDSWTPDNPAFTDVVDATAALSAASKPADHGVLTVYAPYKDPTRGRDLLLVGDRKALADPIVTELKHLLPDAFAKARLAEVRLTRWGHQHLISRPGLIAQMRAMPKRFGNVLLAHSDGQGMPAVESAIAEAMRAAAAIRG